MSIGDDPRPSTIMEKHDGHSHKPHACPMWILIAIFVALLVLTVATVFTATQIDLGPYNLLLAMAIALLKGALVALFFMHLWWDSLFNSIAIVAGIGFLALFIGFTVVDTYQYEPSVLPLSHVLTPKVIEDTAFPVKGGDHEAGASHEAGHDDDHHDPEHEHKP